MGVEALAGEVLAVLGLHQPVRQEAALEEVAVVHEQHGGPTASPSARRARISRAARAKPMAAGRSA
jgi:hypothetical protein